MKQAIFIAGIFALMGLVGCAAQQIPTYPAMNAQASLNVLAQRARSISTVSGQGTITLSKSSGQSVRLDLAMVLQPADRARLRAWKLGNAVFDLTLTPQGVWMIAPQEQPATAPAGDMPVADHGKAIANFTRRLLGAMTGSVDPGDKVEEVDSRLYITHLLQDGTSIRCTIDRDTLTARQFILRDRDGAQRFELALDDYAMINGIPWPRRIAAKGPDGSVLVEFSDIEINGVISPRAFKPPARAQRIEVGGGEGQ